MTNPTPLSPAALAVLDAYMNNCGWLDGPLDRDYRCVAAVLRAAADGWRAEVGGITQTDFIRGVLRSAEALDEIAAELEGANDR